jgi:glycosyltransferase involved in cell wall biosynthesis
VADERSNRRAKGRLSDKPTAPALPTIASYCATFLPREMLHVYRQVCGVRSFDHWIITRRRANATAFPFPQVVELQKTPWRLFHRLWHRVFSDFVPLARFEITQMLQFCRHRNVSLAHAYLGSEALRILPFLERFSGARVISFHGADLSDAFSPETCAPLWHRAELFLCRSQSLREQLLAKGCPANRVRLNYTGVPVPEESPARRPPDVARLEPLRLLQACRFIPKKGLDATLHAVKLLKNNAVPASLTLAGEGPEEPSLRTLARELGIADQVTFTGFLAREQLEEAYRRHHLFVHPSRTTPEGDREGIPNSVLEAMAYGLPVVSTRHSGIPEAITDGQDGLLVEHPDPSALAAALQQLIDNPSLYERLSRNAHDTVLKRFSLAANAAALEALYREALSLRQ